MTDATLGTPNGARSIDHIRASYLAQVQRRRLYGGLVLMIFVLLMVSGFMVADDRNAGGFWDGLHQIGDSPAEVLAEAWQKRADLPGLVVEFFPALIETINIAAVSSTVALFRDDWTPASRSSPSASTLVKRSSIS